MRRQAKLLPPWNLLWDGARGGMVAEASDSRVVSNV